MALEELESKIKVQEDELRRLDQTIGAGVLWILGDVVGLPFVLVISQRCATELGLCGAGSAP